MMTRTTNHARAILKKLAILPILAGALFLFSSRIVLAQDKPRPHAGPLDVPSTQEGISVNELNEYNDIVKKHLDTDEKGLKFIKDGTITTTERERLNVLYKKMNRPQQNEAFIGFIKTVPAAPRKIPTPEQFEKWKDPAEYGIWLNGYKIRNEELNKYKATDLVFIDASKMIYTEAQKKYLLKRYKLDVIYKVKLLVLTSDKYETYQIKKKNEPEYMMFSRNTSIDKSGKTYKSNLIIN